MPSSPTSPESSHSQRPNTLTSPAIKKDYTELGTAVGATTFYDLVKESTIFIDKTLLIKEFLKNKAKVLLITCPRRWGKSMNMDMIKTFLEINVDEEGNKITDKTKTTNYKLFAQGIFDLDRLKSNLLIAEEEEGVYKHEKIIKDYLGEYPVISVDFKDVKGENYQEVVDRLKNAISKTFKQHKSLYIKLLKKRIASYNRKHNTFLPIEDQEEELLETINDNKILLSRDVLCFSRLYYQEATDIDIENSLYFLSELLYENYGKRVFILMDEYDTPINSILQSKKLTEIEIDNILQLFRSIMGKTFKGNEYLEKGLITGILRLAKSSLFSDLNNLTEYNFLNNPYARYYGFTHEEIQDLFNFYKIPTEMRDEAQRWYNGYRVSIGSKDFQSRPEYIQIYSPWSIINFLQYKNIRNYWEQSGNIDFIKNLFKIQKIKAKIQSLLSQEDVEVNLNDLQFTMDHFSILKKLLNSDESYKIENPAVDLFFEFIFAAGYLTIAEKQKPSRKTSVRLPNKEISSVLENILLSYYETVYEINTQLFQDVTDALGQLLNAHNQNTDTLKESLQELFKAFPPFVNIKENTNNGGVHGNEDLVHSVINYTAIQIKEKITFGTEVWQQNKGRADIILTNKKCGMIIELKYSGCADEALTQTQKYMSIFEKHNKILTIKCLGISVSQDKMVDIRLEQKPNPNLSDILME